MQAMVSIPNMGSVDQLVDLAVTAERAGWDGVALWDHLQFLRDAHLDVHDPWVLLGAIAGATERVRLGTLVTPLARRRPQVVSKELVTLDHLSGGRAFLGVGLGEPAADEFAAFGEPAGDRARADRLDESLAVLDRLVRGEAVRFEGEAVQIDAHLLPASVQRPRPPVWVSGKWPNRRPMRRAARWDGAVPIGPGGDPLPPAALAEAAAYVAAEREELGLTGPFDLLATRMDGTPADAYAAIPGVTWIVESVWPMGAWQTLLRERIEAGPPQ